MSEYDSNGLQTISNDEQMEVPKTRLSDPRSAQDYSRRLIDNDSRRSWKRARVNGLCDGNPPYKLSKLKAAGRADAANFNDGSARGYMESGSGAFYDLFAEAPGYITIKTDYGIEEQRNDWSAIISKEADRILRNDTAFDYNMQVSQYDMVLHGCGPFLFEDAYAVLPKAFHCGDLFVPERTKSDTSYWDGAMITATYWPPELYKFIENEEAAAAVGWNVDFTKRVIANAMDVKQRQGIQTDWEWYQQELKNNSFHYVDDSSKVCRLCHVFWKEFDGRITHAIVERESTVTNAQLGKKVTAENADIEFLYRKIGRYDNWQQAIHPMYFDHGNGGFHHSVTGLGVKMYSMMEYKTRLICNLCDKAFAPKILFKPTTTESAQKFQLAVMGDYAVLPPNFDWQQTGVAGLMNDGLAMHESLSQLLSSNLSSYRQQVPPQKSGNPVTAYEKQLEASQQSALNKTQFNRYYQQLDMLYAEIYRRLSNLNSTDPRALEFQKRCKKQGVPDEALARVELVEATRVVGQGSAFMRKQAVDSLFGIIGSLPEDGRDNLIDDKIAAEAGQPAVARYNPKKQSSTLATDQQAEALQWVGSMKVGVPPVVTPTQNPVTYAATFLNAAVQAVNSVQQGANPMEVVQFLDICGPAIAAHLQRLSTDPTRRGVYDQLQAQWEQLSGLTDQLKKQIQQQQQAQAQQAQQQQQVMSEQQLTAAKTQSDIQIKQAKAAAGMQQSQQKHRQKMVQQQQQMVIEDAKAAADIRRQNAVAKSKANEPSE